MIYRIEKYDYTTKEWRPSVEFKSTVSRIRRGYFLSKTDLVYPYLHRGQPVAPTCLAKWVS